MPALKAAFEAAGFTDVKTVLGSGNVVFDARSSSEQLLQQKAEAAMQDRLGKAFMTIVRSIELPVELDGARILALKDGEIFSAYLPNPKGPVFMTLIDKTFGKDVTTRTWDTVAKVAR
ncbi:MAG: hypothetical protein AUI09_05405 [Gemmatimonadetes bacterium 13_2_20CM_2_66_5]|nr:MAG: hypothetical protein AUI09_05405 [Gemmatimonadetes bacterium 13_2_20CM_2_66_5]